MLKGPEEGLEIFVSCKEVNDDFSPKDTCGSFPLEDELPNFVALNEKFDSFFKFASASEVLFSFGLKTGSGGGSDDNEGVEDNNLDFSLVLKLGSIVYDELVEDDPNLDLFSIELQDFNRGTGADKEEVILAILSTFGSCKKESFSSESICFDFIEDAANLPATSKENKMGLFILVKL